MQCVPAVSCIQHQRVGFRANGQGCYVFGHQMQCPPCLTESQESAKIKLDARAQTTCFTGMPGGFVANGRHTLLVGTEAGVLLSCHAVSGSMRLVANLSGLIPAGGYNN